jgi:hypothetical protein
VACVLPHYLENDHPILAYIDAVPIFFFLAWWIELLNIVRRFLSALSCLLHANRTLNSIRNRPLLALRSWMKQRSVGMQSSAYKTQKISLLYHI